MMDPLAAAAIEARRHAHAPLSKFLVGAALVAVFKAMSEGTRKFTRLAIATGTSSPTPPCGACRQILWEFCGDIEVILVNPRGITETSCLKDLFPRPFDASSIR